MTRRWATLFAAAILIAAFSAPISAQQPTVAENCDRDCLNALREDAEQGNSAFQFLLGQRYLNGEGVPKDPAEAVRWFRLSAEQGDVEAAYLLGHLYSLGDREGVPEDAAEAVRWYLLVAEAGLADSPPIPAHLNALANTPDSWLAKGLLRIESMYQGAWNNLGSAYANGSGVPQDDVEAYKWLNLATVYADASLREMFTERRDDVAEHLTPQQRADGQKLSREWFAAHPRD